MAGEQNYKVFLTFKDEATGKFMKATNDQIASMKKLGITVKKEGAAAGIDLDKMAKGHERAARAGRYHKTVITELQGAIGSLRNILLLYFFAMRPILKIYNEITTAAIAQENAETKLAAAFAATGRGSQESVKNITELASKMQTLTGYSDDQIISASALLATYKLNEDQIKKVIPSMLDMTAALRASGDSSVNLEAIAKRLGLAFTGQASYLKRYGIVIDETTAKYGTFDDILKAIQSSISGVAEAMGKTYAGQVNILKQSIADLNEQFGFIIIQSPVLIGAMQLISESIVQMTKKVEDSRNKANNFLNIWLRVSAAIIGIIEIVKTLWRVFLNSIRLITIPLVNLIESFIMLIIKTAEFAKKISELTPLTRGLSADIQSLIDKATIWKDTMRGTANSMWDDFSRTADAINNFGNTMMDTYSAVEKRSKEISEALKLEELLESMRKIPEETQNTFDATTTFLESYASNMTNLMSEGFFKIMKGDFEGLKDVVKGFGDAMLKTITEIIAKLIIMTIWKRAAGLLGFAAVAAHSGGYIQSGIESSFGYGKRYHSGGEVNATLLEGEGVLNRRAMSNLGIDNLNKLNRGEGMGGQVVNNYYIQTIDERSFRERLQEHGDIYNSSVGSNVNDNGSLRTVIQRRT